LSETLGSFLDYAGGPQHAEHVLRPLEKLCAIEESTVREKATESVKKILAMVRIKDFEVSIMGMLSNLMNGDCYSSKFAAIQLIPCVYTHFSSANQQEIMNMFNTVSQDETP